MDPECDHRRPCKRQTEADLMTEEGGVGAGGRGGER